MQVSVIRSRTVIGAVRLIAVMGCVLALDACSKVPDALNPAEWYRSTTDLLTGEDSKKPVPAADAKNDLQKNRGAPAPGADGKTPNLASVDQQAAKRDAINRGLSADPNRPQYAPSIQRQGQAETSLIAQNPPAAPVGMTAQAPQQPAPPPMPRAPVATAMAPAMAPVGTTTTVSAAGPVGSDGAAYVVDKEMQGRLARQLAEIRARAADQGSLLASELQPGADGQGATVVVSSGGVETAMLELPHLGATYGGAPVYSEAMQQSSVSNQGALPLPNDATKVATILFGNGSANLGARERKILTDVTRLQKQNQGNVRIVGHASLRTRNMDPVKHKMANFEVSVQRANQIAAELKKLGVPAQNILVAAVGDNSPQYFEVMPSGEAGNRRAEIYLSN